jgi:hypothetical protein
MAFRIPLVINAGQIEQLQSGDQILIPAATTDIRSLTNGEASTTLVIGMAVYVSAASTVKRAQANALSTSDVVGLVYDTSIATSVAGNIAVGGVLTATTTQWDAVAGTSGGLTFNTIYYLDPTNIGKITATAPTTVGQVVVQIGTALNTTDMDITIRQTVLL